MHKRSLYQIGKWTCFQKRLKAIEALRRKRTNMTGEIIQQGISSFSKYKHRHFYFDFIIRTHGLTATAGSSDQVCYSVTLPLSTCAMRSPSNMNKRRISNHFVNTNNFLNLFLFLETFINILF